MKPFPDRALLIAGWIVVFLISGGFSERAVAEKNRSFELQDGDRVVLLGDTLIEREQLYGYLEERLTIQFPERNIVFRNLGWSADTPQGASRASFDFDKPGMGLEKLKESVASVQPTVVILGYGMANSLEDLKALERTAPDVGKSSTNSVLRFKADMVRLMETIQSVSTNQAVRFVLLSPIRHEDLGPPLPEPTRHNELLRQYETALKEIAAEKKCEFISLFDLSGKKQPLTDNGIHLTGYGYARMAEEVAKKLGWKPNSGLKPDQAEALRLVIVKKNELYFNRWRPQNETYLFGFRKHEQGQNAKEVPMFDPLVAEQEAKIAELRKPVRRTSEMEPASEPEAHFRSVITMKKGERAEVRGQKSEVRKESEPPYVGCYAEQPAPLFEVAPGFEVNLYAESPLLAKPIQMNFDPQGRLWIASSAIYPQIQPGQVADDKILILEDTNGDGYAEKSTVFADGLMIPTAVIPGDGGAYVGQGTELLHFKGRALAKQARSASSSPASEPKTRITSCTRCAGGRTGSFILTNPFTFTATSKRPTVSSG